MTRPLRISYEGALYHVTARGHDRRRIFFSKRDFDKFREYLAEAKRKYHLLLHAYVLMSNHYHMIIETPEKNLSRIMHDIHSSYTTYTNLKRKRSGHLFEGRYQAIVVDKENYLLELSRYLHLNPVRANIVHKPEEYPYSSYRTIVCDTRESIVTRDALMLMMANNGNNAPEAYRAYVESALGQALENPVKKAHRGIVLGNKDFFREVLKRLEHDQPEPSETSQRMALRARMGKEEIITALCSHFGLSQEEITKKKCSKIRNTGIYLMKKYSGASNKEIGKVFGAMSYSAVTKACQRFEKMLQGNGELLRQLKDLEEAVQGHV